MYTICLQGILKFSLEMYVTRATNLIYDFGFEAANIHRYIIRICALENLPIVLFEQQKEKDLKLIKLVF